jgi:hypothetical protein
MGEAKRRGDYARRKAEAIAAGRVKVQRESRFVLPAGPEIFAGILSLLTLKPKAKAVRRETGEV